MIERFSQGFTVDQLVQRYGIEKPTVFEENYNISPAHLIPVITHQSPDGVSYFYWGVAPKWVKNKTFAEKTINVRAELIPEKPVMLKTLSRSRCIIPADGFYCWKRVGKKTAIPWRFTSASKEVLSIAGLWEEFEDEGEMFHTFSMITSPSISPIAEVCERMPLMLTKDAVKQWLDKTTATDQLVSLLAAPSLITWNGYSVSPQLNDVNFNRPSLLWPTPPADQFGNLTLFN